MSFLTSWTNESHGNANARTKATRRGRSIRHENMQTILDSEFWTSLLNPSRTLAKGASQYLTFNSGTWSRWKCVLLLNASSTLHEILGAKKQCYCCLLFAKCSTIQFDTHTFGCTSSAWKNTAGMITNTHNYKTPLKPTKNFGTLNETGLFASEAKTCQIDKQWQKCVNKSIHPWCKTQHGVDYIQLLLSFAACVFPENNLDLMIPKPHWFLTCNLHCTLTISMLCFFGCIQNLRPKSELDLRVAAKNFSSLACNTSNLTEITFGSLTSGWCNPIFDNTTWLAGFEIPIFGKHFHQNLNKHDMHGGSAQNLPFNENIRTQMAFELIFKFRFWLAFQSNLAILTLPAAVQSLKPSCLCRRETIFRNIFFSRPTNDKNRKITMMKAKTQNRPGPTWNKTKTNQKIAHNPRTKAKTQ